MFSPLNSDVLEITWVNRSYCWRGSTEDNHFMEQIDSNCPVARTLVLLDAEKSQQIDSGIQLEDVKLMNVFKKELGKELLEKS